MNSATGVQNVNADSPLRGMVACELARQSGTIAEVGEVMVEAMRRLHGRACRGLLSVACTS